MISLTLALTLSALAPAPAGGGVLTVGPGGTYPDIQSAVNAAVDGDTIVVEPGNYGTVLINGKGVTIWSNAIPPQVVSITGGLRVVNTTPAQTVTLVRLAVFGANTPALIEAIGFYVDGNQGPVIAHNCHFQGARGEGGGICYPTGHINGFEGAFVRNSDQVEFRGCTILGGEGAGPPSTRGPCYDSEAGDGGVGLEVLDASVMVCEGTVTGGDGGPTGILSGHGGHGAHVKGPLGVVSSANATYTGGDGGFAWDFIQVLSGDGGDGLRVNAAASVTSFGDTFVRGAPGGTLVCCQGSFGQATSGPGQLTLLGAYCQAGSSASGCKARLSSVGTPSASFGSGFFLQAVAVEGDKDGLFFFGTNGRQQNPWGNGTSYQCVVPPVMRGALLNGSGTPGACDGTFSYDLNARWAEKPAQNPGTGAVVQAQLWYRDPQSTSNQTTSLSDALELLVCP